ncbi:MAG TPA: hypothetical protein VGJ84_01705 [Polyangiaceae bacterium]|jgi:hypothetical protein
MVKPRTRLLLIVSTLCAACGSEKKSRFGPSRQPENAELVSVDRFSPPTATLMVRTAQNGLPEPNQPIDFDRAPFITKGLGPSGEHVQYYNFDIRNQTPAKMYIFVDQNHLPLPGQLNVLDQAPGDPGYNDFWQVHEVTVPADYPTNSLTSETAIQGAGLTVTPTDRVMNGPVIPRGSSATLRFGGAPSGATPAWYDDKVVDYWTFETDLVAYRNTLGDPFVPEDYIWVAFQINPSDPGGGPASGFVTEPGTDQTHNVVRHVAGQSGYSPLWMVIPYDNASFAGVSDVTSAQAAPVVPNVISPLVNCPVVSVQ